MAYTTYAYDANGNRIQRSAGTEIQSYQFDIRNQIREIKLGGSSVGQFLYDYQGLRIRKTTPSATTRTVYDGQSVLLQTDADGNTLAKYTYGSDHLFSLTHHSQPPQFYLFDALGSVVALAKLDGALQARYDYDAWGNPRANAAGDSANIFGFTGHERDAETGLYYFKARYYDPAIGQFLTQDAFEGMAETPPSLHQYLYAYANPTVYVDPDGHTVYKYTDENGKKVYSDRPRPNTQEENDRPIQLENSSTESPLEFDDRTREEQKKTGEAAQKLTESKKSPDTQKSNCDGEIACDHQARIQSQASGYKKFSVASSNAADVADGLAMEAIEGVPIAVAIAAGGEVIVAAKQATKILDKKGQVDLKQPEKYSPGVNRAGTVGVLDDAFFAQVPAKSTKAFSEEGQKIYSQAAGQPIQTVSDLAEALKQGVVKPSQVPLDYVVIDGQKVIANTRSSTALINADVPKSQWYGIDKSGVKAYGDVTFDDLVRKQLNKNYGGSVQKARR